MSTLLPDRLSNNIITLARLFFNYAVGILHLHNLIKAALSETALPVIRACTHR